VETIVIDETAVLASYAERTEWLRRQSQYQEVFPFSVSSRGALSPPFFHFGMLGRDASAQ